jgi:hypothetical protein
MTIVHYTINVLDLPRKQFWFSVSTSTSTKPSHPDVDLVPWAKRAISS